MKKIERRKNRKVCKCCRVRWARFSYRGRVRWDAKHDLCFRCFRSAMDRFQTKLTAGPIDSIATYQKNVA